MKLLSLILSLPALGLFLVSVVSAYPISVVSRAVAYGVSDHEGVDRIPNYLVSDTAFTKASSVSNTLPCAQIFRREEELLYGRAGSTWEAFKEKIRPQKKQQTTAEEQQIKIWRLQNKLNKEITKHNAAVAKVQHGIGDKVIVASYRGDPADRNMAVQKAQSDWNKVHKYVDITVTEQTHKKTVMVVYHNGPGTPKTVPTYFFIHDR